MSEIYQGPVQPWQPDDEGRAAIAEMLESDDELYRAYGEAYSKRCYIREFSGPNTDHDPQAGLTAVGDMDVLLEIEFRHGIELDPTTLSLGDCVDFGAVPGAGSTRAERVLDGVRQIEEARKSDENPNEPVLYGSIAESGYVVEALIPRNSSQKRQWTVRFYTEKDRRLVREETIPMAHEPIFGVDVDDNAALEQRVQEIFDELNQA